MISVTLSNDSAEGLLEDLRRVFPALVSGGPLPPMVEQPQREPAPAEPMKRTRKTKDEAAKEAGAADAGESAAPAAETNSSGKSEPEASTGQAAQASADGAASGAEVPDIELVRAKLKTLGATDGLGHDKVFEVLGRYDAKNASTVPPEKRAALIAEIDVLLAGVGK